MEPLDPESVKRDLMRVNATKMHFSLNDFRLEDRENMLDDFRKAGFNVTVEGSAIIVELNRL